MRSNRDARVLDRISASRMHVEAHVALTAKPASITLRFKLNRMGFDLDDERVKALLDLADDIGTQQMLARQSISTRYTATKRKLRQERIWK